MPDFEREDFKQQHWRKSPQWSLLTRPHAELVARDCYVWDIISGPCAAMNATNAHRNATCAPALGRSIPSGAAVQQSVVCVLT